MTTADLLTQTLTTIIRAAGWTVEAEQTEAPPPDAADDRPQAHVVISCSRTGDWLAMKNGDGPGEELSVTLDIRTGDCAPESVTRLQVMASAVWAAVLAATPEQLTDWSFIQIDTPQETHQFADHVRSVLIQSTFRVLLA